jgi:hypothetical protein
MTSAESFTAEGGNVTELRFARPGYNTTLDSADVELIDEDAPPSDEEFEVRSLAPSDAAALTRAIYRSYGWTYPHPELYFPERIAAAVESGKRIGEVAVTRDGEVVGHWGAVYLTPKIVNSGLAITDPRFRRRGIGGQLGQRVETRLLASEAVGRVSEPVLTHTATQELALKVGGAIVGAYLSYGVPVTQVGFTDGLMAGRRSLSVAYFTLKPMQPGTLWIPTPYEPFVRPVVETAGWPRELGGVQRMPQIATDTVLATKHDSFNRRGEIDVREIGADLIESVDAAMTSLRRSGAEVTHVRLPANDPALASLGEGLTELGLAYAAIVPEYNEAGDALVLQSLGDPDVDTSLWHYANDSVEQLISGILAQVRALSERDAMQRRRAARRAALFAALDR